MTAFQPTRADGRSDRRVVYELIQDAAPDSIFSFAEIKDALSTGVDTAIAMPRLYSAVRGANKTLLTENRRYLSVVKGIGYRVIRADEHLPVALGKKQRAELQIRDGIELLRQVELDELTPAQRQMHSGQLMIMDGVYRMVKASEKRQKDMDAAIDEIRRGQSEIARRIERIEGSVTA